MRWSNFTANCFKRMIILKRHTVWQKCHAMKQLAWYVLSFFEELFWTKFQTFFFGLNTPLLLILQMLCSIRIKVRNKVKSKHSLSRSQIYTLIFVLGLLAACLMVIVASQEATEDPHNRGMSWLASS